MVGIPAGSRFAPFLLLAVLIAPLDAILTTFSEPQISVRLYVDDVAFTIVGSVQMVASLLFEATELFISSLEALGFVVSRGTRAQPGGKTVSMASSHALFTALRAVMKPLGIAAVDSGVYLGHDLDSEVTRFGRPAQRARMASLSQRM